MTGSSLKSKSRDQIEDIEGRSVYSVPHVYARTCVLTQTHVSTDFRSSFGISHYIDKPELEDFDKYDRPSVTTCIDFCDTPGRKLEVETEDARHTRTLQHMEETKK